MQCNSLTPIIDAILVGDPGERVEPNVRIRTLVQRPFREGVRLHVERLTGSAIKVITPDDEFVRMFGFNLMDFRRRQEAAEFGLRQGRTVAANLRDFWE